MSNPSPFEYDPQYLLQVKDLKKYFPIKDGLLSRVVGHVKAVDGVTFNLKRGTTMGLVGESGCGKTTLVKLIAGLLKQQQGQILFNGKKINEIEKNVFRSCVAVVCNKPFFFSDSVKNNLKM